MMEKSPAQTKVMNSTPTITPGAHPESPGLALPPIHCSAALRQTPGFISFYLYLSQYVPVKPKILLKNNHDVTITPKIAAIS